MTDVKTTFNVALPSALRARVEEHADVILSDRVVLNDKIYNNNLDLDNINQLCYLLSLIENAGLREVTEDDVLNDIADNINFAGDDEFVHSNHYNESIDDLLEDYEYYHINEAWDARGMIACPGNGEFISITTYCTQLTMAELYPEVETLSEYFDENERYFPFYEFENSNTKKIWGICPCCAQKFWIEKPAFCETSKKLFEFRAHSDSEFEPILCEECSVAMTKDEILLDYLRFIDEYNAEISGYSLSAINELVETELP